MKRIALAFALVVSFYCGTANAAYDENMSGVVTEVITYAYVDQIYFKLNNQPASHPACDAKLFSIDATVPAERRKQMLSRLLVALSSKSSITIGYDSQGDCSHGRIRVYRVG